MHRAADPIPELSTDPAILAAELRTAIMHTSRRLRTEASGDLLTPGQYSVLAALRTSSATLRALAKRERVQPPSMTRTVASLLERGLVDRIEDPHDRRQVIVSLTDAGRQALADARECRNAWLARRLAELTPDQRKLVAEATALVQRMSRT